MCAVDQAGLDQQVLVQEICPELVVGLDATDLGRGDKDIVGLLKGKKALNGALVQQVELGMAARDHLGVSTCLQAAQDRAADHAPVA